MYKNQYFSENYNCIINLQNTITAMNLKITLYTFALFFVTLVNLYALETTITGKIEGKLPDIIYCSAPVNGSLGFSFSYTTKPDAQGNFTFKIDFKEIAIIDLFCNYTPAGSIIVTPGNNYTVTINTEDKEKPFTVEGDNTEYQKLYNGICKEHGMSLIHNLGIQFRESTAADVKKQLQEREAKDIAAFQSIYKAKGMQPYIFNYIKTERSYFYACVAGYVAFSKYVDGIYKSKGDFSSFKKQWGDIYTQHPVSSKGINKTPWGYFFLNGYINYKGLGEEGADRQKFEAFNALATAQKVITAQYLEFYIAANLHDRVIEGSTDKNLINTFDDFKKNYPLSGYAMLLEEEIAPIRKLHNTSTNVSGNTVFIDNYATINSFNELIKKFPGKKLYFDVWATWCGPCRQEFAHKDNLYKLLKEQDITVVYISLDKDDKDEDWKKMINFYGLEGQHVRVNEQLDKDLEKLFGTSKMFIPWYILVGKDGKIVKKHAAPPSNMDKLKKDISTMQ